MARLIGPAPDRRLIGGWGDPSVSLRGQGCWPLANGTSDKARGAFLRADRQRASSRVVAASLYTRTTALRRRFRHAFRLARRSDRGSAVHGIALRPDGANA
ncbi:hypothetical protein Bcep18194_A5083 [Burkholderia lata]|uniref:Uncharacterized protein n=1 Tax=Burkholderia lata (strain ATCC 17760 / DSM 23089 / LMG 22485 / NCIMB 9086 / R18194 / 383) TaxID=482957 RepID=Q39FT9_BURL3|nr:hypothetical protein Bcep18194_A5083 [Burkholderia lata]